MKKLFLILFALLLVGCVPVLAQSYQTMSGYGYSMKRLNATTELFAPNTDTTFSGTYKRAGALKYRTMDGDNTLFVYNGNKWIALGTGSLGDSYLRISNDTIYYRKASGGEVGIRLPFANYDSLINVPDSFLAKHHTHPIYDILHLQDSLLARYTRTEIDAILLAKADTNRSYDKTTSNDLFISYDLYGQPNGVTPLDSKRRIPLIYLPESMSTPVVYMGTYNGDMVHYSNPDATDSLLPAPDSTNIGYYFNVDSTFTKFGLQFHNNDWIVSDGIAWRRILGSEHDSLFVADGVQKKDSTTAFTTLRQLTDSLANHRGTVTSVAQTVPAWLNASGSPITVSGTLAITAKTGQSANEFLGTPDGSTGAVSLRALAPTDIPSLAASKIGSGIFSTARLGGGTPGAGKYVDGGTGNWTTLPTTAGANDGTLTLATSGIATGSASFTANQSTASTFTVNVPATNIAQGTRTSTTVPVTSSTGTDGTLSAATTSLAGVMTASDKTKLDGIEAGANDYTLPLATTSTLGGVIVGPGISVNGAGTISTTAFEFIGDAGSASFNGDGTTTTFTVTTSYVTTTSQVLITPTSADAAKAWFFVSVKNNGSFVVTVAGTTPISGTANVTFDWIVVNPTSAG